MRVRRSRRRKPYKERGRYTMSCRLLHEGAYPNEGGKEGERKGGKGTLSNPAGVKALATNRKPTASRFQWRRGAPRRGTGRGKRRGGEYVIIVGHVSRAAASSQAFNVNTRARYGQKGPKERDHCKRKRFGETLSKSPVAQKGGGKRRRDSWRPPRGSVRRGGKGKNEG